MVYLADDVRLGRRVALKVLTNLGPGSEAVVQRFRREAEVSKLNHPGICGVLDAGAASGVPYIAMQYVEGETLADRIAQMRPEATAPEGSVVSLVFDDGGGDESALATTPGHGHQPPHPGCLSVHANAALPAPLNCHRNRNRNGFSPPSGKQRNNRRAASVLGAPDTSESGVGARPSSWSAHPRRRGAVDTRATAAVGCLLMAL